jgi:dTDP-4-dehydrorhamnose reductase
MKRRIAVVGKNGRLGAALCRIFADTHEIVSFGRNELNLSGRIEKQLEGIDFDLMISAAAATNVDWCEQHEPEAEQINARAVASLGKVCRERGVRCLHVSTDYVFDGRLTRPCTEDDLVVPISVYGRTKRLGEQLLLETDAKHLAVRVSWVFGPDKPSFIDWALDQAATRNSVTAIDDKFSAPTYTPDFADWIRPILFDLPIGGVLHLCNSGGCTWRQYAQFAVDVAREAGVSLVTHEIQPSTLASMKSFVAARPVYTVLATEKFSSLTGIRPRPWQEAVRDFVRSKYSQMPSKG